MNRASACGRRGSILEHDHAVVGSNTEFRQDLHDLQARHFLLRQDGVGAIGEEDVGLSACHDPGVLVAACAVPSPRSARPSAAAPSPPAPRGRRPSACRPWRTGRRRSRPRDRPWASRCRRAPPGRAGSPAACRSSTSRPSLASAHSRLRANTATLVAARPASASLAGWPTSAEAKTCAASPFSIRSRRRPEGRELKLDLDAWGLGLEGPRGLADRRLQAAGRKQAHGLGGGHGRTTLPAKRGDQQQVAAWLPSSTAPSGVPGFLIRSDRHWGRTAARR